MNSHRIFILLMLSFILISFKLADLNAQTPKNEIMNNTKKGGIVFFSTLKLEEISKFYIEEIGCELWLDQGACRILKHGNMLLGFCQGEEPDKDGVITFFYPEKEAVDTMYSELQNVAKHPPKMNPKFRIYHFYAEDPEGRAIEFQFFDHQLNEY